MIRKGTIFLILISMMLHCAARMNFLSYLFEHRQEIAFSLGLIDEIPIAVCKHDYDSDRSLKIETHETEKSGLPATLFQAREIILFIHFSLIDINPRPEISMADHVTLLPQKKYTPPGFSIFHPPA